MPIRGMLAALVAAAVVASPAALGAQQSPEQVVQAYLTHFRAGEMDRVAALMHPRALESFRTVMLRLIGDELEETPLAGRDDVATMPADSFYLFFMEAGGQQAEFSEIFQSLQAQPVGHVAQGDSLAHVVYTARMDFMGQQAQQTAVLTLRRHGNGWRVDPGDGPMNMVGGGLMSLVMTAGMQAGMAEAFSEGMDEDPDEDSDQDDGGDPPSF